MPEIPDPWRANQFEWGYSAEFLPAGEKTWRIIRKAGKVHILPTRSEALFNAKQAFLARYEPPIRATTERSEEEETERMAAKWSAKAEEFLKSKREDVKAAQTNHRGHGKRSFVEQRGRV